MLLLILLSRLHYTHTLFDGGSLECTRRAITSQSLVSFSLIKSKTFFLKKSVTLKYAKPGNFLHKLNACSVRPEPGPPETKRIENIQSGFYIEYFFAKPFTFYNTREVVLRLQ